MRLVFMTEGGLNPDYIQDLYLVKCIIIRLFHQLYISWIKCLYLMYLDIQRNLELGTSESRRQGSEEDGGVLQQVSFSSFLFVFHFY